MRTDILSLLLVALGVTLSPSADPLLPALHHARHDARGWMERFEASDGSDFDALWCLYRGEHRTPEVRAFLRRWLAQGSPRARREVEAILLQWEVAHDAPPSPWPADGPSVFGPWNEVLGTSSPTPRGRFGSDLVLLPRGLFAPPAEPLDCAREELGAALEGPEPRRCAGAVVRVVRDGDDPRAAARALIDQVLLLPESPADATTITLAPREDGERPRQIVVGGRWAPMHDRHAVEPQELVQAALDWIADQCPTATGEALVDALRSPVVGRAERARLLTGSRFSRARTKPVLESMTTELARLAARDDAPGALAWRALLGRWWALVVDQYQDDWIFHGRGGRPHSWGTADPGEVVALLHSRLGLGGEEPWARADVDRLTLILLAEPELRREFVPLLRGLASRSDACGLAALRGLCHLGVADHEIRALYLRTLERGVEPDEIPCLVEHDERTLSALERAFDRADGVAPFVRRLAVAGLLDHERSPLARRLAARIPWFSDPEHLWAALDRAGYTGPAWLVPFEPRTRRADKLSIRARTLRAEGRSSEDEVEELIALLSTSRPGGAMGPDDQYWRAFEALEDLDVAPERMADACLEILLDPGHWNRHVNRACEVLEHAHLDRRQQALLCRAEPKWSGEQPSPEVFARQGEACLERVARLRLDPYFDLRELAAVLAIARPAPSDLEFLAAAVARGPADDRLEGLELVDRYGLDTSALREAVRAAARHPEPGVAERARELLAVRGW